MSKLLVAYFSAEGTTRKLAEKLAKGINADLFEIKPEMPYTKEDLNWQDSKSRSSVEMNDRGCRPAIHSKVEDMSGYKTVFVGFPIWWYREPSVIDTFMEAYDFCGKTVIPFATSGGSGLGGTAANMAALTSGARIADGKRYMANATEKELLDWAAEWI